MIGFAMSKKWIDRRPDLFALPHHDIHRIMQKCVPDLRAGLGHKDVRLRLTSHQHWQRADVIEVRMRNQNGIDLAIGNRPKVRQSILALLFGMHAAIEHDPLPVRTEIITIGADLGPTRQVNELQEERQLARSLPRDQTTNSPLPALLARSDGADLSLLFLPPISYERNSDSRKIHAPNNYSPGFILDRF